MLSLKLLLLLLIELLLLISCEYYFFILSLLLKTGLFSLLLSFSNMLNFSKLSLKNNKLLSYCYVFEKLYSF